MLDSESEQIREVYAMYGLAMYEAQCLERELAMAVAVLDPEKLTAWDYDARLAENFDSTFGQMVTRFAELARSDHPQLVADLASSVDDRNKLAHRYFWERAVTFCSAEGRSDMLRELQALVDRFASLDEDVSSVTAEFKQTRGITDEASQTHLKELLAGTAVPFNPKRVRNPVVLTSAYEWRAGATGKEKCKLIIASEDDEYLLLGEKGLCLGPQAIPANELFIKAEFAAALPAKVNPRPKKALKWDYTISLAHGYELRVRPAELGGRAVCRFGLRRISAKTDSVK